VKKAPKLRVELVGVKCPRLEGFLIFAFAAPFQLRKARPLLPLTLSGGMCRAAAIAKTSLIRNLTALASLMDRTRYRTVLQH
jgi:hypothetical protein